MNVEQVLFYFFAAMVLGSALLVVTMKSLVRSLFMFFVTLFSVAGIYIFSLADFIAVTQVVIYVGGVLVLMLFAFLLSNKELLNDETNLKTKVFNLSRLPVLLVCAAFLFILTTVIVNSNFDSLNWITNSVGNQLEASDNTIHLIGMNTMTVYLLPFEITSVFLLMALIGAAHLARKEPKT